MLLKLLDNLFDVSDHLTKYIVNTPNPSTQLIESTFELLQMQLQQVYHDKYKEIFADDGAWEYFQMIVQNVDFLKYRVDKIKQLTEQDVTILFA